MPDNRVDLEVHVSGDGFEPTEDDVLQAGRHRSPRLLQAGTALGILAVLVLVLVNGVRQHSHPTPATNTAQPPSPAPTDPQSRALSQLIVLAESADRLQDQIRSTTSTPRCPSVRSGRDPVVAVTTALQQQLPGFTFQDSALVKDGDGTLCGLTLRERDGTGSILTVVIVAPPGGGSGPGFALEHANDRTSEAVIETFLGGWQVEVGWIGRTGTGVDLAQLEPVAQNLGLRW